MTDESGFIERQLLRNHSAHRPPEDRDLPQSQRPDQTGSVMRQVGDAIARVAGLGLADATVVEDDHVMVLRKLGQEIGVPFGERRAIAGNEHERAAMPEAVVADRAVSRRCDLLMQRRVAIRPRVVGRADHVLGVRHRRALRRRDRKTGRRRQDQMNKLSRAGHGRFSLAPWPSGSGRASIAASWYAFVIPFFGTYYMVAECYAYRGKSITIHLHELYRNGWVWSFSVDGVKGAQEPDMVMSSPE